MHALQPIEGAFIVQYSNESKIGYYIINYLISKPQTKPFSLNEWSCTPMVQTRNGTQTAKEKILEAFGLNQYRDSILREPEEHGRCVWFATKPPVSQIQEVFVPEH